MFTLTLVRSQALHRLPAFDRNITTTERELFKKKKALKYIYGLNEFLSKIVCGYFERPAFNMVNCNSYLTCVVPSPHFSTFSVFVKKGAKGKGMRMAGIET